MYTSKIFKSRSLGRRSLERRSFFFLMALFLGLSPLFTNLSVARAEGDIEWIQRVATYHNRTGSSNQVNTAIGSDGNVYIASFTDGVFDGQTQIGGIDAFIRKYAPDGAEIWTRQFGTTYSDSANGIAVDSTGVYVAGSTLGTFDGQTNAGQGDAYVAKHDLDGNLLWLRQFGGTHSDHATGIAVTADGVYVTGFGYGAIDGSPFFGASDSYVRKYSPDGALQWSTSFGTEMNDDAQGIAANDTGVYVAVYSSGAKMVVKKFDLSGSEVWSHMFTGEGVGLDDVTAISVYGSRVVVVGGTSRVIPGQINQGGLDAFIKTFDTDGAEIWTRQFGTPGGDWGYTLAVDASGVYVGGITNGQFPGSTLNGAYYDAFVRRYSLDGEEGWTLQFGTPGAEMLTGMGVGPQEIYLGGKTKGALDDQVSSGGEDAFIKKIDLAGASLWTRQFNAPATVSDYENASAVDANGNVYLAGYIRHSMEGSPYIGPASAFLAKYSPEGVQQWMTEFTSQKEIYDNQNDMAFGVAADTAGNVYLTGFVGGVLDGHTSSGESDAFLIKYDSDGNVVWTRQFGSQYPDAGYQVAVDASGVYVAGTTYSQIGDDPNSVGYAIFVQKYTLDGEVLWTDQFTCSDAVHVTGMAIDSTSLYLGGYIHGALDGQVGSGSSDAYLRQYSLDGSVSWTRQFGTSGSEQIAGIDVDGSGIYVTGYTDGVLGDQQNAGGSDLFVQKYSLDGNNLLWTRMFGTAFYDYAGGVAVDQTGVYVVGRTLLSLSAGHSTEAYLLKFSLDGADAWSRTFDYQTELGVATGVSVDTNGIYVVGQTMIVDHFNSADATLIKLSLDENEAPVANPGGPYLGAVNTSIQFDGSLSSDPDGDTLTYAWDFGDGATGTEAMPAHTYTTAGVYNVCLTVNDGSAGSEPACTMAVVYDPSAGFVTGGGWIDSPAGAYIADPSLAGKATFGFVSKYQKGASVPTGNTAFQFDLAGMAFASQSYEWLVVNQGGSNAQFKGSGLINGAADPNGNAYKFMLWAADSSTDTFRIRIWWEDPAGEHDVYDNGADQTIGGGNIVVHTRK